MNTITKETRMASNETVDKKIRYIQITDILSNFPLGMTAKEIAVEMWERGFTPTDERNFSAPRLTELEHKGIVKVINKTKCKYTNKTVAVYRLCN